MSEGLVHLRNATRVFPGGGPEAAADADRGGVDDRKALLSWLLRRLEALPVASAPPWDDDGFNRSHAAFRRLARALDAAGASALGAEDHLALATGWGLTLLERLELISRL